MLRPNRSTIKISLKRNKNNILKYDSWVKRTADLKPVCFSRRSLSSDKIIKLICTLHVVFGEKNRQVPSVSFFSIYTYVNKGSGNHYTH